MKKILFVIFLALSINHFPLAFSYEVKGNSAQELYNSLNRVFGNSCDEGHLLVKSCQVSVDLIICTKLPMVGAECLSTSTDPETGEIMIDRLTMGRNAYSILKSMRTLPESQICDDFGGLGTCHLKNVKCTRSKKFLSKRFSCEYSFLD